MAHQSGFGGSIAATGGPTGLVAAGPLQGFVINQSRGTFEAYGKGEAWVTTFATVRRWNADVTCLVPDGAAAADIGIGSMTDPTSWEFKFNTNDKLTGAGYIEEAIMEDPLDGPVVARLKVRGNGALTPTVS